MSSTDLETMKSLLHFNDFLKDEIGLEAWTKENTNVTSGDIIKFGHGSLYPYAGALLGTNTTDIWNLNSNGDYEIEFFVYVVKHGGNRYLFRLMEQGNSSPILMLSLTTSGYIQFISTGLDITTAITGSTALTIKKWYHVLIRVSNQTLKVFLDGAEEINADLPDNITLNVEQVRIGYFNNISYKYYMDEFAFRHSARSDNPTIPLSPYSLPSQHDFLYNTKSLLHFDDLTRDEIAIETWKKSKAVLVPGDIVKFGHASFYPNTGYLLGTNNSGIWSLNSNGDYEIEFFIYPVAHGGTRYLLRLLNSSSSALLTLSLNANGTINFTCSNWGCSGVNGTTALAVNEWQHIMLRISNQATKVFINGAEDISVNLSKAYVKLTAVTKVFLGYFSAVDYAYYMDEFLFRYSAGTGTPTIPVSPYTFCGYKIHKKRNFGTIKSLLHFDYPYFNEPNDGLGDEIGIETWTKSGSVALYGTEIPKAGTLAPKFGYRCFCTNKGSVQCNNESGIWNLSSQGKYEIGMFVYITQTANEKNIFSLMDTEKTNSIYKLSSSTDGMLNFEASAFGVETISGTTSMAVKNWYHILMRISKRKINIYLDGNLEISAELSSNTELAVGQVRIGNDATAYPVFIDEFIFKHSADKGFPIVPTEPYNAYLDNESVGGYGTGLDGDVIISANTQINSYGLINAVTDNRTFNVLSWSNGTTIPDVGTEIMIHITAPKSTTMAVYPFVGLYSFAKIADIHGAYIVLDRDITTENGDDFTLDYNILDTYYVQAITVPNYSSFTINSGCTITPLSWNNTKGGGIVAFRCSGECVVNGAIITHGKGAVRYDLHQMTHSQLADRFLCSHGGGIFLTCGGTFTATNTARLGGSWSGLGENGNGASGYGGNGGNSTYVNKTALGGAGGVGGGGGGAAAGSTDYIAGGAAGSNGSGGNVCSSGGGGCGGKGGNVNSNSTSPVSGGGGGGGQGGSGGAGGIVTHSSSNYNNSNSNLNGYAGTINGGASRPDGFKPSGGGGGAPGGDGSNVSAGTSIILVSDKLKADFNAISTGGACGYSNKDGGGGGGGGTGFCYIAAGELLNG